MSSLASFLTLGVIITQEVKRMEEQYAPFVTVLRTQGGKYYAAVMKWDDNQQRYDLDWPSKFKHVSHSGAVIDAEAWAQKMGYETRNCDR